MHAHVRVMWLPLHWLVMKPSTCLGAAIPWACRRRMTTNLVVPVSVTNTTIHASRVFNIDTGTTKCVILLPPAG